MTDVVALIDGFNVYHALDKSRYGGHPYHKYKWINYWKLAECFVPKSDIVSEVRWFTAEVPREWRGGDEKRERHLRLMRANEDQGVLIVRGRFRPVVKTYKGHKYSTYEEKRTDVAIAVALVSLAYQKAFNKMILMTGDSDVIPAIKEAKRVYPSGIILNVVPIERRAKALKKYVDQQITMRVKHLQASRFPNILILSSGKSVLCPSGWKE